MHTSTSSSVALVTGASSGIGYDIATILAKNGHNLILVARNVPALESLARDLESRFNIKAAVVSADLTDPSSPQAIFDQVRKLGLEVNILINNAGFGGAGKFDTRELQNELDMIQVNITALTALTRLFLPDMVKRGKGRIMNVASTAAFQPGPGMAVYYATKAYVLSLSEAVADEVRKTGVTVTALCPGPTKTGFAEVANVQKSKLFSSGMIMDSRTVAEIGYKGMMSGKSVVITGWLNKLGTLGARFVPRKLVISITRRLQGSDSFV